MRLGVNVPNFGPGTDPAVLERWARVAEGLGYDLLMMSDHVAVTADVARIYPGPFHDPFTTLAWLAGRTDRIRLGTTVLIMPYRHPALTAQMAAGLHRLSGGRFVLGVGVGWAKQEFAALGLDFGRRGATTDEYLSTLRSLWSGEESEHLGQSVQPALSPDEVPGPPIWIGGNSDAGIRRTIRFGDAWHPLGFTMPWLHDAVGRMAGFAADAGRPLPALAPRIKLRLTDRFVTDEDRPAGIGNIEQVLSDLSELRELGAETVLLDAYHGDPEETRHPQAAWRDLAIIAERAAHLTD